MKDEHVEPAIRLVEQRQAGVALDDAHRLGGVGQIEAWEFEATWMTTGSIS